MLQELSSIIFMITSRKELPMNIWIQHRRESAMRMSANWQSFNSTIQERNTGMTSKSSAPIWIIVSRPQSVSCVVFRLINRKEAEPNHEVFRGKKLRNFSPIIDGILHLQHVFCPSDRFRLLGNQSYTLHIVLHSRLQLFARFVLFDSLIWELPLPMPWQVEPSS